MVRITTPEMRCTGFAVGLTQAITAEHCIGNMNEIRLNTYPARVVKSNDDFALLEIVEPALKPLPLAKTAMPGEDVLTVGFAKGQSLIVYRRLVAGFADGSLILDGPITPGMSGGPVLNMAGEVIGLNQATLPDRGFACPVNEIRNFLK